MGGRPQSDWVGLEHSRLGKRLQIEVPIHDVRVLRLEVEEGSARIVGRGDDRWTDRQQT
jgi:hypothetical protein